MIATAPTLTEYQHIVFDDRNRPLIAGTTMKVVELVMSYLAYGWSPEELHFNYPHISMGQIYAALGYYWDHKVEMDAEIERIDSYVEEMRKQAGPSPVAARLRAKGLLK